MSEMLVTATPTRQAVAARDRSAPGKVTGRLRRAVDAMVWEGAKRPQAAETAGLTDHSLRQALRRPHVLAFYHAELKVLRESERARNIHALADVRDGTNAMARVNAVRALEGMSDETQARSTGCVSLPGLTIQIINAPGAPAPKAIGSDGSDAE